MTENIGVTANSISRRNVLRKSTATGAILVMSGTFASSASAQPDDLIEVEITDDPDRPITDGLFLGTCGVSVEDDSFEVSVTRGRGRTEVEVSAGEPGIIEESFTLGGPNPVSQTVTVSPDEPLDQTVEIIVTATLGRIEDQESVTGFCIPPIQ